MKIENVSIMNIENAIRGMRNPLESWDKSDSGYGCRAIYPESHFTKFVLCKNCDKREIGKEDCGVINSYYKIGDRDLELAKKLVKAGSSDRKFLRQIFVSMDITGPLYWWKEMDTYKVGTTANSTSTMHKLSSTPISMDCFEMDDFDGDLCVDTQAQDENGYTPHWHVDMFWGILIIKLEELRLAHNAEENPEKKKALWKELIRLLPESWLQTRTWTADYETLRAIYHQRKNHKLSEWHTFCEEIKKLPYSELITE